MITIEKVSNGYIVIDNRGQRKVFLALQEVFDYLLLHFEGLAVSFSGELFGQVIINTQSYATLKFD